jgi:hypothetical protein
MRHRQYIILFLFSVAATTPFYAPPRLAMYDSGFFCCLKAPTVLISGLVSGILFSSLRLAFPPLLVVLCTDVFVTFCELLPAYLLFRSKTRWSRVGLLVYVAVLCFGHCWARAYFDRLTRLY